MKSNSLLCALLIGLSASSFSAEPGLTIYNQHFAVVRDVVPLELQKGINSISYDGATAHLEPDSVILRNPQTGTPLPILEQNFRNDPVTQELLLSLFEGQTIPFLIREADKPDRVVDGKIIRSGYVPHNASARRRYGQQYAQLQLEMAHAGASGVGQPIIEIDGQIRFGLPGQPLFPSLGDETILKPQLNWKIASEQTQSFNAELGYITGGLSWEASYNVVSEEKSSNLEITGWITMDNQSGRDFAKARIQLMAGDVNKIQPNPSVQDFGMRERSGLAALPQEPALTQRSFDEYHLYTIPQPTTLRDRETKQVEMLRATNVHSKTLYLYDGVSFEPNLFRGADTHFRRTNEEFGLQSQNKVAVVREFANTQANHLGIPLPAGRVRFYRRDTDGTLQFTGENQIDHTPVDESVRIYTGDAFDLVGERKRTQFQVDSSNKWAIESFEITLRNQKSEPVEIRVIEHLYRWNNWKITDTSDPFVELNSEQIEFQVTVQPGDERSLHYTVRYTW